MEYKLQLPVVDIRNQFDAEWRAEQERLRIVAEIAEAARKVALRLEEAGGAAAPDPAEDAEDPGGDMMGDEDKRRRLGPPMEHRKELKKHRRELRRQSAINLGRPHGRRLAIEAASKDDPRLQDLNEIEFELKQSRSGLIEPSPIRTYLNLESSRLAQSVVCGTIVSRIRPRRCTDGEFSLRRAVEADRAQTGADNSARTLETVGANRTVERSRDVIITDYLRVDPFEAEHAARTNLWTVICVHLADKSLND